MFTCRECGKEFEDWHALGGHMRTHRGRKGEAAGQAGTAEEQTRELVSRALGRLSDLSPQEAWQIVVNWIVDVHRQLQLSDETIRTYRLRLQDSESRAQGAQGDLRRIQLEMEQGRVGEPAEDRL